MSSLHLKWIGVDWGTTNLRAWGFDADGNIIQSGSSSKGMSQLAPSDFEVALLEIIEPWLSLEKLPVICCGMVGAKQGWVDAGYRTVPCTPDGSEKLTSPDVQDSRLEVHVLPGLMQKSPADVMRGEETQIAGFLSQEPEFDGNLCLPGTHTKWVQFSAGEVVIFRTFMSGELFAVLSNHSVLKHSVANDGWSDTHFLDAINDAMTAPQNLAAKLFNIRAEGLLNGLQEHEARARLSGYLIGLELKATREFWLGNKIALIGASQLNDIYGQALKEQSVPLQFHLSDDMTILGLKSAYDQEIHSKEEGAQ